MENGYSLTQGMEKIMVRCGTLFGKGPRLLLAIVILVVGLMLIKWVEKLVKKILLKSRIDETAHKLIVQIVSISLKVLVFLMTASQLGIDTASLVTLLGAVGLAVSLAVKDSLGNLAGGFWCCFPNRL